MLYIVIMTDYTDACIYRIIQIDNDELIYIGSTNCFNNRIRSHKNNCKNENHKEYTYPVYKYIRDNGGFDNFKFEVIIEVNCYNKYELELVERSYIDELKPKMNKKIPTRTKKERYNDNKERRIEYDKEYRKNNKERIREQNKVYYNNNKDVIAEKSKVFRDNNKELVSQRGKDYYYKNIEYEVQRKKEYHMKNSNIVVCDNCGANIKKYRLTKHKKTNYCINFNKNN
jgi:hypothetical protein